MDYMALLQQIFQVCIIPLLGILTTFLVAFIKKKIAEMQQKSDSELFNKYMEMLKDTVVDCVIATNQTYVEALKDKNAFDAAAQREAFKLTYNAVLEILGEDITEYLNNSIGDINTYIIKLIEAQVNINKSPSRDYENTEINQSEIEIK